MTDGLSIYKTIYSLTFDSDWVDPPIMESEHEFEEVTDEYRKSYGGSSTLLGFVEGITITSRNIDGLDATEPGSWIKIYTLDKDKIPELKAKLIGLALQWTEISKAALLKQLEECGQQ